MKHPFELEIGDLEAIDLEFEESLALDEAAQVDGGVAMLTTNIVGEESGEPDYYPRPFPHFPKPSIKFPIDSKPPIYLEPPIYTTLALGEEGGSYYLDA